MLLEIENENIICGSKIILQNFSFCISEQDRILLLGKNGSGKTTLMNYIGKTFNKRCRISYLRQNDMLLPYYTVFENLRLVGGGQRAEEFLQKFGLMEYRLHYPYELSGGIHRRLLLLRAMLFPYDLLLLDEPLANLDAAAVPAVCELIEEETKGRALLLSTHQNLDVLSFANKRFLLKEGGGAEESVGCISPCLGAEETED